MVTHKKVFCHGSENIQSTGKEKNPPNKPTTGNKIDNRQFSIVQTLTGYVFQIYLSQPSKLG